MMFRQFRGYLRLAIVFLPGMLAFGDQPAPSKPVLFKGGEIVTLDPSHPNATAMLVLGGNITAFDDEALNHPATADADVVDLAGATAMPAWIDAHAHPLLGGPELECLDLRNASTNEEILDLVRKWADAHPNDAWILGHGFKEWVVSFDAKDLDTACKDRPVVLKGESEHYMWVNSEALRRAGINKDTPTPWASDIPRRPDGEPIGVLIEWNAMALMQRCMPARSVAQDVAALRGASDIFALWGITYMQDCLVTPDGATRYLEAAKSGALSHRASLAFIINMATWRADLDAAIQSRALVEQAAADGLMDQAGDPWINARTAKFFADGGGNGMSMTDPFSNAGPATTNPRGLPQWTPQELNQALIAADNAGFQVHVHAMGDAGIHQTLDSIEAMAANNGPRDRRPCMAHNQVIQPGDIARYGQIGIIAVVSPYWCGDKDMSMPLLGPARNNWQYPYGSLANSGCTLAFNSDWAVDTASPLSTMPVAIRRVDAGKPLADAFLPSEALTPMQALIGYTQGAAYAVFQESRMGMLKQGMRGDIVVLAKNPLKTPVEDWPGIPLLGTWRAGVAPTPYATWQRNRFSAADIDTWLMARTADFDNDGIPTLLEYAFGTDPKVPNPPPAEANASGSKLQISFPCDATRTDVSYTVQSSTSLDPNHWIDIAKSTGGSPTVPIGSLSSAFDSGTGARRVTVTGSTAIPPGSKRFLRIKVSNP